MPEPAGTNRRVVLYGNPVLRQRARRIETVTDDIRRMLEDLKVTMLAQDGLGLAANQIGELVAVYAINPRGADIDEEAFCIINPELAGTEGNIEAEEGCLSLPGVYDFLRRPEFVRVKGLDERLAPLTREYSGLLARALIHELEHLSGTLFIDHLSETRRRMRAGKLHELEEQEKQQCG